MHQAWRPFLVVLGLVAEAVLVGAPLVGWPPVLRLPAVLGPRTCTPAGRGSPAAVAVECLRVAGLGGLGSLASGRVDRFCRCWTCPVLVRADPVSVRRNQWC